MASSSASSRHQVTITLGRSGQVVKRRAISDIIDDDEVPLSGKKRSVRERLGSSVSDFYESQQRSKRRQTERSSPRGDDSSVHQVGKDDLRLKLMRKGMLQRSNGGAEQRGVDLREKLSRNHKNSPRYDARGHAPDVRVSYDMRDNPPELRSRYSLRDGVLGSRPSSAASRVPPARSADDLLKLDSSRKPYSSWTDDGLRDISPRRLTSVRDASPPRAYDQIRPVPSFRSVSASRPRSLITRDDPDTSSTQPYAGKSTISVDTAQRVNGNGPSGAAQLAPPVMTEVPLTVTGLLNSLGLEKYLVLFQAEEVDMAALRQMGESDLKDMGVPMGPRKKILLAVGPQSKQRQR
ncbi:hypothetical protein BS78_06G125300 [Paspalum vaginatum]|nr:hypothetical protein BS78_06G125300 [Paspalum vaginatum]